MGIVTRKRRTKRLKMFLKGVQYMYAIGQKINRNAPIQAREVVRSGALETKNCRTCFPVEHSSSKRKETYPIWG